MAEKRPVTLQDIADQAKVSKMTVSLALRADKSISPATRERILHIAAALGYRRDPLLSALSRRRKATGRAGDKPIIGFITRYSLAELKQASPRAIVTLLNCVKATADELGYRVDTFHLDDYRKDFKTLAKTLYNRGIFGLLLGPGVVNETIKHIPWERFITVVLGNLRLQDNLQYVSANHQQLITLAVGELHRRKYKRVGLWITHQLDALIQEAWLAHLSFQLKKNQMVSRIPALIEERWSAPQMLAWVKQYKIDAILTLQTKSVRYLQEAGYNVPHEIGVANLDALHEQEGEGMSGIDQRRHYWAVTAVELLDFAIQRNRYGLRNARRVTQIDSHWIEGHTLRPPAQEKLTPSAAPSPG